MHLGTGPAFTCVEHHSGNSQTKLKGFAKGDLEHATETLTALWEAAGNGGDV